MSVTRNYKRLEEAASRKAFWRIKRLGQAIGGILGRLGGIAKKKYTIMLIPHFEDKVINIQVSLFLLLFLGVLLVGVVAGFVWTGSRVTGITALLEQKEASLSSVEANLDKVKGELSELREVAALFKQSLAQTASLLGETGDDPGEDLQEEGDLAGISHELSLSAGDIKELAEIRELKVSLQQAVDSLSQVQNVLNAQKELLVNIPSIWPVQGGRGIITQYFGPSIHPFYKYWYLHKGVDIAYPYAVPILATANGKVVEAKSDPLGWGNYVVIRHRYGFYTRYAHLQYYLVKKGQEVHQGQVIGMMGSTGLSTGRHLHYEVMIGSEVIDPLKFLNISHQHVVVED
ncbi:M23 family metallopeptidase [Spirochaeta thermophila]|uniref:M23/M37 peptidase domain protein n=1 Tax=Winmispira thermophila (strain ATCC 49972 / DSM 6192 / RI 19.B1) TaxID=665571 RepID=E0RPL6_WINT6|nr:M23 family metallopeptidase [Spirochaeta thermophila]ADN02798.1 M23/M37 peptidase domain protein [Spirochaeta thermophila DSM 6192]